MRDELERVVPPGEEAAEERTWRVVAAAYAAREPVTRPSRRGRIALSAAIAVGAVLALVSPPGRAVIDRVRDVVGVEKAQPALFSLPAPGRLLVASDAGVWVVQGDGSRRLLGRYREASWSPFGRFVVAARANELAALEPDGGVRWTLPRRAVRSPLWEGTETDTRIAYAVRSGLRVVAGDGAGDRLLTPEIGPIAWRPGRLHTLASLQGSELRLQDGDTGQVRARARAGPAAEVLDLSWSPDGRRALVVHPWELDLVDPDRDTRQTVPFRPADVLAAAFSPDGKQIAVLRANEVLVLAADRPRQQARRVFAGAGTLEGLAWSPDGRWLLVGWKSADQWVFVRTEGTQRIRAVSNVSAQFRSQSFPRVEGWCCAGG